MGQRESGKDNQVMEDTYGYLMDTYTKRGVQLFKVVLELN